MISVLILTRNEQLDLPGCLASVAWSNDIHVFDSFSTDSTPEIARAAGAHLHQRVFDDYATHRNAALKIPFAHPWVLILDADERPTTGLCAEMRAAVERSSPEVSGFRLRRRDFLFGTWLKHAQMSPFYIRLVRPERSRYVRPVNEVIEVEGAIGDLKEPLDHFPFSKGMTHWIAKHNAYSIMEAELIVRGHGLLQPSWHTALRDPDFHTRRLHQKAIFYRLPARPLLKWLYLVMVRGSFLDGWAGMTYATLQAIYEYFIVLKVDELKRRSRGL
jgi:glycosyltransferase involved in cell wall biosynthesis